MTPPVHRRLDDIEAQLSELRAETAGSRMGLSELRTAVDRHRLTLVLLSFAVAALAAASCCGVSAG